MGRIIDTVLGCLLAVVILLVIGAFPLPVIAICAVILTLAVWWDIFS